MKKIILIVGIFMFYLLISNVITAYNLIPEEAIRIRVIANSDDPKDQAIKQQIKSELETFFYSKLKEIKGISNASIVIRESIPEVKELITAILGNESYEINYGMNYFPEKEYKGIKYKEGYYESLVVTLGTGLGKNWWCVLFPPLCLLDNTEMEDVEYRSLVADVINKYF